MDGEGRTALRQAQGERLLRNLDMLEMRPDCEKCGRNLPADPHGAFICSMERSEEHTSEFQSLMRISYAVFCMKKKISSKLQSIIINSYTTLSLPKYNLHIDIIFVSY